MKRSGKEILIEEDCPYNSSIPQLILSLGMMLLGVGGLFFFNLWVATAYLVIFFLYFFMIIPLKACQYCYYNITETVINRQQGKIIKKQLPIEDWKEKYLQKHKDCWKKWGIGIFVLWLMPIVGLTISFFVSFSVICLICLIGFVSVLIVSQIYRNRKICPACAICDVCPFKT